MVVILSPHFLAGCQLGNILSFLRPPSFPGLRPIHLQSQKQHIRTLLAVGISLISFCRLSLTSSSISARENLCDYIGLPWMVQDAITILRSICAQVCLTPKLLTCSRIIYGSRTFTAPWVGPSLLRGPVEIPWSPGIRLAPEFCR